VESELLNVK